MSDKYSQDSIVFLKLGGSLITNKTKPFTPQRARLNRIAREIKEARQKNCNLKMIIGHGSGSFGHVAAHHYHTRQGVNNQQEWAGFAEVWLQARRLNQIVIESLYENGLPVIAFPPSSSVVTRNGKILSWDISPMIMALENGLIPVIQGDVIFDKHLGGTILSTEELFLFLAGKISTNRVLLAGVEDGVWADFPGNSNLVTHISPQNYPSFRSSLQASGAVDVTGGMLKKVQDMIELIEDNPSQQVLIFSGVKSDNILKALLGENPGTLIAQPI